MRLSDITGPRLLHIALIYAGALSLGAIADSINLPLPWMIGAMVFSSAVRLADYPVNVPGVTRPMGQVIVSSAVGITFTAEALATMVDLAIPMVAAALLTVVAGFIVAAALMRMARVDVVTASLASIPMGPVESATLAERHGVAPGPVVLAQTFRIMVLVLLIPPILVALDGNISDPTEALRNTPWTPSGAALMLVLAVVGAFAGRKVGIANPFFVGPLGAAAIGTVAGLPVTAYPYPMLVGAQVFLGVWLGAVLDRALIRRAGSFVPGAVVASFMIMVLCVALGLGLTAVTGQPWQVMVLATAPGSVTEMALTAKVLQEGIAVVTAFHLVRIFIILPSAPLIIGTTAKLADRFGLRR
ncbi:AbrB family transcriptional regulator [Halovulum dunhuangense]|uniref:AbrB family transcriptional regulator n=1 Tax=Halovulum dunhuangense TaxID=1505036 RepID=A0A849L401_9RHOB|nr:AbrB family transcriptional regulator [Halovulum dunhuangense]NNU80922.1 AbrB family transcriptional regulator [Halovulum dunhuangense]